MPARSSGGSGSAAVSDRAHAAHSPSAKVDSRSEVGELPLLLQGARPLRTRTGATRRSLPSLAPGRRRRGSWWRQHSSSWRPIQGRVEVPQTGTGTKGVSAFRAHEQSRAARGHEQVRSE